MKFLLLLLPSLVSALCAYVVRPYRATVGWLNALLSLLSLGAALAFAGHAARGAEAPVFGPGELLRADGLSALLMVCVTAASTLTLFLSPGVGTETKYTQAQLRRYQLLINLFIFSMLSAVSSNNVAIMWVALEATTIISALLIPLTRSKSSVEASWKYILIGSVGIAPMHTWKPDAYGEAPPALAALMSSALFAVAMYAILRWKVVADAAIKDHYADNPSQSTATTCHALTPITFSTSRTYPRIIPSNRP